jgi:hypothetical protein
VYEKVCAVEAVNAAFVDTVMAVVDTVAYNGAAEAAPLVALMITPLGVTG